VNEHETGTRDQRVPRGLPLLVAAQVAIAAITVVVAVVVGRAIPPLIQEKQRLEADTVTLRQELDQVRTDVTDLTARRESLLSEIAALEKVVGSLAPSVSARVVQDAFTAAPQAAAAVPRVYIHVVRESQREEGRRMARVLQAGGYVVPGIEQTDTGPRTTELRYFHRGEESEVRRIARVLEAANAGTLPVRFMSGFEGRVRPRHYEIWVGVGAP
jgi:hypothetical protein